MEATRRAELERIMSGLAGGDLAMVVTLRCTFGDQVRAALVTVLREVGVPAWRYGDDELDGLVDDACFELGGIAGGWRADGGALPWVWGRLRLVNLVHRWLGPPTVALDGNVQRAVEAAEPAAGAAGDDPPTAAVLARLAAEVPAAAVVQQALEQVLTPRDRELLLVHTQQVASGDPSPAVTLGRMFGYTPAAVRKRLERGRRRLAALADDDPRYAVLRTTTLLGPRRAA